MTKPKHVPECFNGRQRSGGLPCICNRLRACEQRIWDEAYANGFNHGRAHGESRTCSLSYQHGLDAAREAVARLLPSPGDAPLIDLRDALAAIDALKD